MKAAVNSKAADPARWILAELCSPKACPTRMAPAEAMPRVALPIGSKTHPHSVVVESAQIDMSDASQKALFDTATHFNPVDLVCSLRGYKGKKFNLMKYRDSNTGFITEKSKDGKALKAQELPGLWNGSMSDWNTVFVEVPLITFNPVKTVNDLLRKEHQS